MASPGQPTAVAAVEGFEVEHPSSAAEAAPEGGAGPGAGYPAEGVAAWAHQCQPSSLVEHLVVDPCGPEQLPLLLGSVVACPGVQPSLLPLGVPCPFADLDPADGEHEEASSLQLPGLLVSVEPSSSEHRLPVGSSWQFLLLPAEGQMGAVVAAVEGAADPGADWEVVGPQHFQPWQHHQAAAGEVLQSRGLVCPGTDGLGKSLGVCWHMEANCWGAVGAAECWSLLHFAAAGPEEASAADVGESSLSPQPRLLHLPFAGTGGEGAEEVCHFVRVCHLAAVAAGLQVQGPFPAVGLEAWPESGSGVLEVGFHQKLGYWAPWYHCSLVMAVLQQVLLAALRLAGPPSACWPSSSLTSGPVGACAAAAAAGAFA